MTMGLKTVYEDRLGLFSYLYRYAVDHGISGKVLSLWCQYKSLVLPCER